MSFSLADALKGMSELDTGREQIEYIRLNLIDSDANNFYQLSEIEGLADNIALCGLQQPIRVRKNQENPERYTIVSGHRRRAAIELLAKDDPEKWNEAACIVERDAVSPALQQLRLIYANASTRKLTPAEISEQAVQVEKLLYQLKEEEGYEFPGRMRDHVAQTVGQSRTKLARLKVIRENLSPNWYMRFQDNNLAESTAYSLAQIAPEYQIAIFNGLDVERRLGWIREAEISKYVQRFEKIGSLTCKKSGGFPCVNMESKREQAARILTYSTCHCGKCCSNCPDLVTCKNACPRLKDKVKKLKEEAKFAKRQEKTAQAEKDRPQIEQILSLWHRFGYLRDRAGKTVKETLDAADIYYHKDDDNKYASFEDGTAKISTNTKLPYNYSCYLSDVQRFIALADLFGCSIDYMLCRTDYPELVKEAPEPQVSKVDTAWQTGEPSAPGSYLLKLDSGYGSFQYEKWSWDGVVWKDFIGTHDPDIDGEIKGWIPMPKEA